MAAEDALCGKGYELTMFLFTDIIVVAKVSNSNPVDHQCDDISVAEESRQDNGNDEVTQHCESSRGGTASHADS